MATASLWFGIEPGDIGFDTGSGIVGWVIRHGSGSAYAHTFIYHELLGTDSDGRQRWSTVEAYPSSDASTDGVRRRVRVETPAKVVRLFNGAERDRLLAASSALADAGARYGWLEVARIGAALAGVRLPGRKDSPATAICSNHVTQAVLAARPSLAGLFAYPAWQVYPGYLAVVLDGVSWVSARVHDEEHK